MGKSSASLKRKRSKNSSKAKASSRSKNKKYKSKKGRNREVSVSSSDYDDSKILATSVSSSSEDSYKRKRGRSRAKKDVKGRKKRIRRNRDSSEDSLYVRKRKKAKRKNECDEVREKPYQKKKIRREASVSLVSSGSWSCSTCQGGSASNDDSQYESHRGRSERKEKDKRRLERGRIRIEKSTRYKARSCSSCSPRGESSYEGTEEKYTGENNSKRLRSVITVTKEAEESRELCRNETKEEIVDDHDYPCRSNDSNDGAMKRELDHHTLPASEEKLRVEDEIGDMNADLNFTEPELRDRSCNDRSNLKAYSSGTSESTKKGTSETSGANLNGSDLETILRQRALENLKKFRGEIQPTAKASDQKNKVVSHVKQLITDKHELIQGKSIVNNAAIGTKFDKQTPLEETSLPVRRRNLIACARNKESELNMDKDISGSPKLNLACEPEKVIVADNPSETVTESSNHRTSNLELTTPESCHDSLQNQSFLKQATVSGFPQEKLVGAESTNGTGTFESTLVLSHTSNDNVNSMRGLTSSVPKSSIQGPKFKHNNLCKGQDDAKGHSELKQTSASHEPPNAKCLVTEGEVQLNAAKITQAAIQRINSSGKDVDEMHSSATPDPCFETSSSENNPGKVQDKSNQGSQFEQKTMTVMRGGEMVQVSYKVYIPKKPPALARRQLKR